MQMSKKEKEEEAEKNLLNADGWIADVLCVDMLVCRCRQWWWMLMVVDGIGSWWWMRMAVDCGGGGLV